MFKAGSWLAYGKLREQDKNAHKVLRRQLGEMLRGDPTVGSGKPEPLKYEPSGLWARRISKRDRLVYNFDNEHLYIHAIGSHYSQFK